MCRKQHRGLLLFTSHSPRRLACKRIFISLRGLFASLRIQYSVSTYQMCALNLHCTQVHVWICRLQDVEQSHKVALNQVQQLEQLLTSEREQRSRVDEALAHTQQLLSLREHRDARDSSSYDVSVHSASTRGFLRSTVPCYKFCRFVQFISTKLFYRSNAPTSINAFPLRTLFS